MLPTFNSQTAAPEIIDAPVYWFVLQGHRLLVQNNGRNVVIPQAMGVESFGLEAIRQHYLGKLGDLYCFAAEVSEGVEPPEEMAFVGLRRLFGQLDEGWLKVGGRAIHIIDWDRNHQFCGRCGQPTEISSDRAKVCPNCGLRAYPRISPAVIMRVQRGNEILLAHSSRHPEGLYSVLAGFAEPGETLEETVAREIYEEVGLQVQNIRYFGSQPWPFPDSLMIGFTCDYAAGEIRLNDDEIAEARWFTAEGVKEIATPPSSVSIAGQLIEAYVLSQTGRTDKGAQGGS